MVRRPTDLTNEERNLCVQFILQSSSNGKPKRGKINEAAAIFGISRSTVSRLWRAAKEQQTQGLAVCMMSKKLGRKRDHILKPNYTVLKGLDVCERVCYRLMVKKMGVSKSSFAIIKNSTHRTNNNSCKSKTSLYKSGQDSPISNIITSMVGNNITSIPLLSRRMEGKIHRMAITIVHWPIGHGIAGHGAFLINGSLRRRRRLSQGHWWIVICNWGV